jgi:hypothetical protein
LDQYWVWVTRVALFVGRGEKGQPFANDQEVYDLQARTLPRFRLVKRVVAEMRRKFPADLKVLDHCLEMYRHSDRRAAAAYNRLVEPVVEAMEFGRIERAWDELSEREQRAFVRASIRRECILLRRSPDVQRSQRLDAEDFYKRLASEL